MKETIQSDRPGQSFNPYTVGKNILQFQGGFDYSETDISSSKTSSFGQNLAVRYGILERVEVNMTFNRASITLDNEDVASGLDAFNVGLRVNLFERESGFTGGVLTELSTNLVSQDFRNEALGFTSRVMLGYPALNGYFTFNGGVARTGNGESTVFLYTFNYSLGINDMLSWFVEPYGNYVSNWNHYLNSGFAFMITKDFVLDISGGVDLIPDEEFFFINGGISYRILSLR